MTKWTGHDGSSDCPTRLKGTRHKVEIIWCDKNRNTGASTYDDAGFITYWGAVAAWRVIEPSLDERLLEYIESQDWRVGRFQLIEELKERSAKDD